MLNEGKKDVSQGDFGI